MLGLLGVTLTGSKPRKGDLVSHRWPLSLWNLFPSGLNEGCVWLLNTAHYTWYIGTPQSKSEKCLYYLCLPNILSLLLIFLFGRIHCSVYSALLMYPITSTVWVNLSWEFQFQLLNTVFHGYANVFLVAHFCQVRTISWLMSAYTAYVVCYVYLLFTESLMVIFIPIVSAAR